MSGSDITVDEFAERFRLVTAQPIDSAARRAAIADFMRWLYDERVLEGWATSFARGILNDFAAVEDALQTIAEHIHEHLLTAKPGKNDGRLLQATYLLARDRVVRMSESGEQTGIAEATSVARRRTEAKRAERELLAELGREPTEREVVERANERNSSRADQRRQGMWFDGTNHRLSTVSSDANPMLLDDRPEPSLGFDVVVATRQIAIILARRHPDRPDIIRALNVWIEGVRGGAGADDHRVLAEGLGVSSRAARGYLDLIQQALSQHRGAPDRGGDR